MALLSKLMGMRPNVRRLKGKKDFRGLKKALSCKKYACVRSDAALALGEIRDPSAVEDLISILRDDDHRVRASAIEALSMIVTEQAIFAVIHELRTQNHQLALDVLPRMSGVLDLLLKILAEDEDWVMRSSAAEALGKIGNPQASGTLIDALTDRNPEVRYEATLALASVCRKDIKPLVKAMMDTDRRIRSSCAHALGNIANAAAVSCLISGLSDAAYIVRCASAEALCKIGTPAVESLAKSLTLGDEHLCWCAIEILGCIGDPAASAQLIAMFDDNDSLVRAKVAEAIGKIADPAAVEALIKRVSDESPIVRTHIAKALGKIGDGRAIGTLLGLAQNPNCCVQVSAIQSIGQCTEAKSAVDTLLKILDESLKAHHMSFHAEDVGEATAEALGRIGDTRALEPLKRASHAAFVSMREAALSALYKMGESGICFAINEIKGHHQFDALKALDRVDLNGLDERSLRSLVLVLSDVVLSDTGHTQQAKEALARIGFKTSIGFKMLINVLQSSDHNMAEWAVETLGQICDGSATQPLVKAASNGGKSFGEYDRRQFRVKCLRALGKLGDRNAVPFLISRLLQPLRKREQLDERDTAAEALGEIGDPRAVDPLLRLLERKDGWYESLHACGALGAIGDVSSIDALSMMMQSSTNDNLCRWSIVAIGKIAHPSGIPTLLKQMESNDAFERKFTAEALGEIGSPRAVQSLIKALHDPNLDVRIAAVEALGRIGDSEAAESLTGVVVRLIEGEEKNEVGLKALAAQSSLPGPNDIDLPCRILEKASFTYSDDASKTAIVFLSNSDDPYTITVLMRESRSDDLVRRSAAIWALQRFMEHTAVNRLKEFIAETYEKDREYLANDVWCLLNCVPPDRKMSKQNRFEERCKTPFEIASGFASHRPVWTSELARVRFWKD